ncbi:unnamed protein product [Rotaria socialis]|uniref:Major facilitator superfamily (MFS) profile domain-containing protein n=1 Tax=Rotaria socialis TaxID=392032 RepID=A0A817NYI9_9BILA|nr:unnamed protein product [Rotaria socialis]CAF3351295.1 unnamed protein product [Rotaria socialis]CAF4110746.1 unnamed protein product [Rotaria socialis]CAF4342954.1 unnamed protein product [Rotaria socialis]
MVEPTVPRLWRAILPICLICFLYLCSLFLFFCATNSLIYSTVCLLRANESFCAEIDQNQSLKALEESIQKESSQWALYGTLSFAIIACIISPVYGSLSDTKNRKLPIILTICNAILTGLIITIASVYQGTKLCLILYIVANIINGFGGGALILISSCFGYATDSCTHKEQHIQIIAIIEASLNIGVVIGYVLCTFVFELHTRIWLILLVHVLLLALALFISLVFLQNRSSSQASTSSLRQKIVRPIYDTHDLIVGLKQNHLLVSFLILLCSLFFYDLFRMGSGSIIYLYLHYMTFDDTHYAAYFSLEQLATCLALIFLAVLRRRWKINDLYIAIIGLCLSLVGPMLFAFARNNKAMIFGAIPSSMFSIYFSVCLRAIIARLVPENDKGKAFSFVALMQNLDIVIGTIACVEIYQASIDFFPGLIFIFAVTTKIMALILILIQVLCISRTPELLSIVLIDETEEPILEIQGDDGDDNNNDNDDDEIIRP